QTCHSFKRGRVLQSSPELDMKLKADLQKKALSQTAVNLLNFRQNLPAYEYKQQILEVCRSNQVIVVSGATGCGTIWFRKYISEHSLGEDRTILKPLQA